MISDHKQRGFTMPRTVRRRGSPGRGVETASCERAGWRGGETARTCKCEVLEAGGERLASRKQEAL